MSCSQNRCDSLVQVALATDPTHSVLGYENAGQRMMADDGTQLIVAMFVSLVGFALFVYGKRQNRGPQLVVGIALMVYPYFVSSWWAHGLVLGLLGAGTWLALRAGL